MIVLDTHASGQLIDSQVQVFVATARACACPLVTSDKKILDYRHVKTVA